MEQQGQSAASSMIASLTGWWELAGLHSAVSDAPVNWLETVTTAEVAKNSPAVVAAAIPTMVPVPPSIAWPTNLEMLRTMIANGEPLPGNGFGTRFISPVGPSTSDVMVVSDLPDQDELSAGTLGSGATGALLSRMLGAIGISLTDCYWTMLATTVPPTGEVPEHAFAELNDFVRYQLGLVKPKSLILLGSAACKALLGEELMKSRAALRNINHDDSSMTVLTTFHPRTLIARPAMKAQAWKDLQMFAKRADL